MSGHSESTHAVIALIVAAGTGQRFADERPKQYMPLAGRAVLRHSAEAFLRHEAIDAVCVVFHPEWESEYREATRGLLLLEPCHGGKTRQESVCLGLEHVANYSPDVVLIHDAARPLVDAETISRVIAGAKEHGAVIPVILSSDSLKRCEAGEVVESVARDKVYQVQTPQGFLFQSILALHQNAKNQQVTDDAGLYELAGQKVSVVEGNVCNFKITHRNDLERAAMLIHPTQTIEYRTAIGFDVHAFELGETHKPLKLCGVDVEHERSLAGHSDADVGIHAIVDALLGALSLGDIGEHFPPQDNAWKDKDSAMFLEFCRGELVKRNASIVNLDVTLICEAPKLSPYKQRMRERIAGILCIAYDRVNIKATTTEKLGFTGRGEGIACQAAASVQFQASRGGSDALC